MIRHRVKNITQCNITLRRIMNHCENGCEISIVAKFGVLLEFLVF